MSSRPHQVQATLRTARAGFPANSIQSHQRSKENKSHSLRAFRDEPDEPIGMNILTWAAAAAVAGAAAATNPTSQALTNPEPRGEYTGTGLTVHGYEPNGNVIPGSAHSVCQSNSCERVDDAKRVQQAISDQSSGILKHFSMDQLPPAEQAEAAKDIEAASKSVDFAMTVNAGVQKLMDSGPLTAMEFVAADMLCKDEGQYKKYCNQIKYLPQTITVRKDGDSYKITPSYYLVDDSRVLKFTYVMDEVAGATISIKPVRGTWDLSPTAERTSGLVGLGAMAVVVLGALACLSGGSGSVGDRGFSDGVMVGWVIRGSGRGRGRTGFSNN